MRAWRLTVENFLRGLRSFFRSEILERRNRRACRFAAYFELVSERASRVHSACVGDTFACERFKLGPESPGPVADDEYLNLIITDPQTIDHRSGKLLPVLVRQVDEAGLSVLRDKATNNEFDITFQEMKRGSDARGKPRYFHGVCRFLARSVRWDNATRNAGVYDTALPQRRHHADIIAPPAATRRDQEARKKKLIDKIGPSLIGVADFREGAFVKYARDDNAN
jgi:hypothetical protein